MRILLTSSRMPFAVDAIRKLGEAGHEVLTADTFATAPGNASRHVRESFVTPSPTFEPEAYPVEIEKLVIEHAIDMVLPAFEEAIYLSAQADRFEDKTDLFTAPFDTLLRLHEKDRFIELAGELGLPVPRTEVVRDRPALREACGRMERYFARPAFSRGGVSLLTNVGPLAGHVAMEQCTPTRQNPWLVQQFVDGIEECSFSVVHDGAVSGHAAYVHPREIDHAGGIVFESVDPLPTLEIAAKVAERVRFTGHLSFDFMRTDEGLVLIECNPRPTAGIVAMDAASYDAALRDRHPLGPRLGHAGVKRKYSMALVRDMMLHWREAREDLEHLFSRAKDVYAEDDDWLPALYQVLSYAHVARYRFHHRDAERSPLMEAYFHDVSYDGDWEPRRVARVGRRSTQRFGDCTRAAT